MNKEDFSAERIGDSFIVKCYRCCCVLVPRGEKRPFKYVNRLELPMTESCKTALAKRSNYYKYPFECWPNSEKRLIMYGLLQWYYQSYPEETNGIAVERLDEFLCCFLGICHPSDTRRLIGRRTRSAKLRTIGIRTRDLLYRTNRAMTLRAVGTKAMRLRTA